MKINLLAPAKLTSALMFVALAGCDVFQKDPDAAVTATESVDVYVLQNKAAVIDLQTSYPGFNGVDLPNSKTNVKFFNGRYIKYQSVDGSSDAFKFTVKMPGNQAVTAQVNVTTQADNACGEAFTYAKIKKNSKLYVNLFNNPEFCNYDVHVSGPVAVSDARPTDQTQNQDGVLVAICSCGPVEGQTAILSYNPPKDFVGKVIGKYYLGIPNSSFDGTHQNDYYDPSKFRYYSVHEYVIEVEE